MIWVDSVGRAIPLYLLVQVSQDSPPAVWTNCFIYCLKCSTNTSSKVNIRETNIHYKTLITLYQSQALLPSIMFSTHCRLNFQCWLSMYSNSIWRAISLSMSGLPCYVIMVHLNIDDLPASQSYFMIFKPFIKQQIEEV